MIIIVGLIVLIAAVVVGVAGVFGNGGHPLTHGFSVLGYHVTGSTGTLFLYGIILGAFGALVLILTLSAVRRTTRRAHAARRDLKQARTETATVSQDRDDLLHQRETAKAATPAQSIQP